MLTAYSWHGEEFDLFSATIDHSKSRYAETIPNYLQKLEALNSIVGYNQYLWAFLDRDQHKKFEICKPVEWVLDVADGDILGYVNNPKWEYFLYSKNHKDQDLKGIFQQAIISHIDQSVLVRYPFEATQIKRKRIYEVKNPYDVKMINETAF